MATLDADMAAQLRYWALGPSEVSTVSDRAEPDQGVLINTPAELPSSTLLTWGVRVKSGPALGVGWQPSAAGEVDRLNEVGGLERVQRR